MKFFHTALAVKSLKETQAFYENVFGFTFKVAGERPALGVKFIMMEGEDGVRLEFFEHTSPKPLTEDLMDFSQVGIKHIAFIVENVEETFAKAIQAGATEIWKPQKGVTVKKLAFFADPNGIPVEIVEQ